MTNNVSRFYHRMIACLGSTAAVHCLPPGEQVSSHLSSSPGSCSSSQQHACLSWQLYSASLYSHPARRNTAQTLALTLGSSTKLQTCPLAPCALLSFYSALAHADEACPKLSTLPCFKKQFPTKETGRLLCHDLPHEITSLSHFPLTFRTAITLSSAF